MLLRDRRPGVFITPGGALDRETHRGRDRLRARRQDPAAPAGALRGRGEPAAGAVAPRRAVDDRPRRPRRARSAVDVRRRVARSVAQHTYDGRAGGGRAAAARDRRAAARARARPRRRAAPACPSRRSSAGRRLDGALPRAEAGRGLQRADLAADRDGRGGADAARRASASCARSRDPEPSDVERLRSAARALGVDWPATQRSGVRPRRWTRRTRATRDHARGDVDRCAAPATRRSTARRRAQSTHGAVAAPYAHATAPLRRLVDRYVSECCLGSPPTGSRRPAGAPSRDGQRGAARQRRRARRHRSRRGVDALRPGGLDVRGAGHRRRLIELRDPAVRAKLAGAPAPGTEIVVRLERADPASRTVEFAAVMHLGAPPKAHRSSSPPPTSPPTA